MLSPTFFSSYFLYSSIHGQDGTGDYAFQRTAHPQRSSAQHSQSTSPLLEKQRRTGLSRPDISLPWEPDIDVVCKLAVLCLPTYAFTHAEIAIFFAQGAFHRLYCILSQLTDAKYLMHVAVPVDSFYRTESEVATIVYIRKHSTIPSRSAHYVHLHRSQ